MSDPAIAVEVEDDAWTQALPQVEAVVVRAAAAALTACHPGRSEAESRDPGPQARPGPLGPGSAVPAAREDSSGYEITVLLTDDEAVRELNARFRGKEAATNVLSFPAPPFAAPHLGDVALAFGVCAREAETQGKSLADHLSHLTVHGVLHLLGYDHEADEEAEDMEAMERRILHGLGVRDPYAHGADA